MVQETINITVQNFVITYTRIKKCRYKKTRVSEFMEIEYWLLIKKYSTTDLAWHYPTAYTIRA